MPYKDYEEQLRKNREQKAKRIKYAKENNLCIQCLKPIEINRLGKSTCFDCTEKRVKQISEDRKFYKQIGICPRCRKNKLIGQEKTCIECKAKQAEYAAKIRATEEGHRKYKERYNRWQREHIKKLKEQGLCTRCGKRKSDEGFSTCNWCRAKTRAKREKQKTETKKERRIREGKCIWCENPKYKDFKVCEKHYQMQIEKANSEKAVANRELFKKQYQDKWFKIRVAKAGGKND